MLQGQRECQALLLAARHLRDLPFELALQPDALGHLGGARRDAVEAAYSSRTSRTLAFSGSEVAWSWTPMRGRRLASPGRVVGSSPSTRIEPALGLPIPMQHSRVVVLPAPLRPSSPKMVPRGTAKLMPATASTAP